MSPGCSADDPNFKPKAIFMFLSYPQRIFPMAVLLGLAGIVFDFDSPAQITTATIVGTVSDSSGAAIQGVNVTVTNDATGFVRSVISDSAGGFLAPLLPLGPYTVTAEKPGFSRFVQRGLRLALNQNARVDVTL